MCKWLFYIIVSRWLKFRKAVCREASYFKNVRWSYVVNGTGSCFCEVFCRCVWLGVLVMQVDISRKILARPQIESGSQMQAGCVGFLTSHGVNSVLFWQLSCMCQHDAYCDTDKCLTDCTEDMAQWIASNRLKLNWATTVFMWCATHWRQHQLSKDHATFTGSAIRPSTICDLAVVLDSTLVWTSNQPVSQPMLSSITLDKELCSNPVDGRQEDSSQQFCHLQNQLLTVCWLEVHAINSTGCSLCWTQQHD